MSRYTASYITNRIEARERVRLSIQLLDEHGPKDWRERIGDRPFGGNDIQNHQTCPLGRIFGEWTTGLRLLGFSRARDLNLYAFAGYEAEADEWNEQLGLGLTARP